MAVNKQPTFPNYPTLASVQILPADTTTLKDLIDVSGSIASHKIVGIFATGEVTASRDLQLVLVRGIEEYILDTIAVPANSGRIAANPPIDLFTTELRALLPKDSSNQPYLTLEAGDILKVKSLATVTATELISVLAHYATIDTED